MAEKKHFSAENTTLTTQKTEHLGTKGNGYYITFRVGLEAINETSKRQDSRWSNETSCWTGFGTKIIRNRYDTRVAEVPHPTQLLRSGQSPTNGHPRRRLAVSAVWESNLRGTRSSLHGQSAASKTIECLRRMQPGQIRWNIGQVQIQYGDWCWLTRLRFTATAYVSWKQT